MTLMVPPSPGCYKMPDAHFHCISPKPLKPEKVALPDDVHISYYAGQWVCVHEKILQTPVEEVVNKVRHISFETFLKELQESVNDAQNSLNKFYGEGFNATDHAAVGVELHKSNQWVAELALENFKFKAAGYFSLGEKEARIFQLVFDSAKKVDLEHLKKAFEGKTIVLFDDGSYSGKQLADHILGIGNAIMTHGIAIKSICVIVPFMTKYAEERIEGTREKLTKMKCELIVAKHAKIDTMNDLEEATKNAISGAWYLKEPIDLRALGLTWFDHKIPNSQSFPKPIANASVFKPDGKPSAKIFNGWLLPPIIPPYKSDLSLEKENEEKIS